MRCPECRLSGGMHYSGCPEEPDETEEEALEREEEEERLDAQREDWMDEDEDDAVAVNPVKDEEEP